MTELRQKMIRAMELKNLSPHTQRAYLAAVTGLARHYRQSPVGITKEMIEDYLLLLKKSRASNSCGLVLTGLRFFYTHVTEEKLRVDYRMRKKTQKLPTVLAKEQVAKIICACDNLKHRLILMTTYAAGLRASEVAALKLERIDSQRMLVKIVDGKGRKDRYTMLSTILRQELRGYYRKYQPKTYLFPSSFKTRKDRPLSYETLRCIYEKAQKKAGVNNRRRPSHPAPQLCHPSVGRRPRYPQNPGLNGPQPPVHHHDLFACEPRNTREGPQPTGSD